ncbi:hypothetical protein ACSBR1_013730 [Camellia fascicularis]
MALPNLRSPIHPNLLPSTTRLIDESDSYCLVSIDYSADNPITTKLQFPSVEAESYEDWGDFLGCCNIANNAEYLPNPNRLFSSIRPMRRTSSMYSVSIH